ncbi:MAG: 16S rRNA (cytidine(1402)-2'-O)-methyltransferase [Hyphomicrobiaceae bacterium]
MSRKQDSRDDPATVAQRAADHLAAALAAPLAPGLYVVATPIGNLGDLSLRAISVLARADVICCEDTRHSRTLLAAYAISRPTSAYHEHNAEAERPRILSELAAGRRIALISDAGTPLVSDPGFKLVRAAAEAGHSVIPIPGASAPLAALAAAGLPTDAFHFAGFLPPKAGARRARLAELAAIDATLVLFEAPSRLGDTLAEIDAVMATRELVVARELTKLHEEFRRGPAAELRDWARRAEPRGEMVILIAPPDAPPEVRDADIETRLETALGSMSLRDAARAVAEDLGVARSRVYDLGLRLRKGSDG